MSLEFWIAFVVLCVIPVLILSAILCKRLYLDRKYDILFLQPDAIIRLASIIFATLIIIGIVYWFVSFRYERISRVNISPIARLSTEEVERAQGILDLLEGQDFIHRSLRRTVITSDPWPWDDMLYQRFGEFAYQTFQVCDRCFFQTGRCSYLANLGTNLSVLVFVYQRHSAAVDEFLYWGTYRPRDYTLITNDNDTQISLLHPSRRYTRDDAYRHLVTDIRIGHARIRIFENQRRHGISYSHSSNFVEWLVAALQEKP